MRTTFNIRLYALRSSGSRPADATRARSRTWLPATVLVICALLATVATSSTSAAHTPYLTVQALSAGRVKITLAGNPPRGRLDFSVDGHRIRRTRGHSITVRLPQRGWHRVAVRRVGAPRLLARTRFAQAARTSRSAPTLVLLTALPAKSTVPTAVLRFSASTGNVTCQVDTGAFKPCTSPASYLDLAPGRHRFTIRATRGNRQTSIGATTAIPRKTVPSPPNADGRQLVFQDDFNGNALNATAWSAYNSAGHAGNGLRRPSAFTVDGQGHLVVTAQNIDGQIVSGGMANRVNQTYGLYEFRVKTDPDPTGTMSGVVLTWPTSGKWPEDGENDIYETGARPGTRDPFGSFVHFGQSNDQQFHLHDANASQWHTMAMDWGPKAIKIYRDGELVWTVTDPSAIPHTLHHLCIQLDAFANRQLTAPVRMYVDWVRIYR